MYNDQEPEAVPAPETEDRYSSPGKLLKLASWAYFLSWVILVLNGFLLIARIYSQFMEGWSLDLIFVFNWAFYLSSLAVGVIWFVILQAISEGIYLWLDIEENSRKNQVTKMQSE
jgi:hypothetical protein